MSPAEHLRAARELITPEGVPFSILPEEAARRYLAMRIFRPEDAVRFADLYQESATPDEHDEFCAILLESVFEDREL